MSMKTLLAPLLLSTPMLAACVLTTDFDDSTDDDGTEASESADGNGCQTDCTLPSGEEIWTVEDDEVPEGRSVVALPDGGFVVGASGSDGAVLRYDASGALVWARTVGFEGQVLDAAALSADGHVLVVGATPIDPALSDYELWVGELSVADGSEQWTAVPAIVGSLRAHAVAGHSDGGSWLAGYSPSDEGPSAFMARLDASGAAQWFAQDDARAEATDVVALPDGSAVFVGFAGFDDGPDPVWASRVDAAGTELWATGFGAPLFSSHASIERRADGTLVLVASGEGDDVHTVVIELDESGVEQQRHTWQHDATGSQMIEGTAIADDGTLYLAGITPSHGIYGALDSQGAQLWAHVLSPNQPSDASSVLDAAVLSDGSVVFVGWASIDGGDRHLWMRRTES